MKLGGLKHEDELHHFAEYLGVNGYFCEFNTLERLWTSRVSSHMPLKDAPKLLEQASASSSAATLIYRSLQAQRASRAARRGGGVQSARRRRRHLRPRGDRDHRARGARAERAGHAGRGPFPADTIFLKARDGELDAIVTMYHDQGQIAIKLMGFIAAASRCRAACRSRSRRRRTAPPTTSPARARPNVDATANAFAIACRMGRAIARASTAATAIDS